MLPLTPYDFIDIDDYIKYVELESKKRAEAQADDGESKALDCDGRNSHNWVDDDIEI